MVVTRGPETCRGVLSSRLSCLRAEAPLEVDDAKKNTTNPARIDLTWGAGCTSGASAHAVYQVTFGAFTTHAIFGGACGLPATT